MTADENEWNAHKLQPEAGWACCQNPLRPRWHVLLAALLFRSEGVVALTHAHNSFHHLTNIFYLSRLVINNFGVLLKHYTKKWILYKGRKQVGTSELPNINVRHGQRTTLLYYPCFDRREAVRACPRLLFICFLNLFQNSMASGLLQPHLLPPTREFSPYGNHDTEWLCYVLPPRPNDEVTGLNAHYRTQDGEIKGKLGKWIQTFALSTPVFRNCDAERNSILNASLNK